jgi:hypothetical protein
MKTIKGDNLLSKTWLNSKQPQANLWIWGGESCQFKKLRIILKKD